MRISPINDMIYSAFEKSCLGLKISLRNEENLVMVNIQKDIGIVTEVTGHPIVLT